MSSSVELGSQQLIPRLLSDINSPEGLPLDFIQELAAKVDEEQFDQVEKSYALIIVILRGFKIY